jgi:hypothetical protein
MTSAGRDVTELVREFHQALRDLYPHFIRLGLTVSSDEWQETCARLLTTLVLAPASGRASEEITGVASLYALWDPLGTTPPQLLVHPDRDARLLVSGVVPSTREAGLTVSFREARADEIDEMIHLREFANPVVDDQSVDVLDGASGYAKLGGRLVRVSVPVSRARFYLAT